MGLGSLQAQQYKIGYFDTQTVLPKMPEYKRAQTEMKTYAKKLEDELKRKQQVFRKQYQDYLQQEKNLSVAARDAKQKQLQKQDADIRQFQQTARVNIQKKEGELLTPIYKKIEGVLKSVAKEGNYNFILRKETSIFAQKKYDISGMVMKKLGIKTN